MPAISIAVLAVQISFAVHAIKRGHDRGWVFIIIFFPLVGCMIYFFVVVLPELRNNRASYTLSRALDPNRDLRLRSQALHMADTVENKINLANALRQRGRPGEAITLYQNALTGQYKDDPRLLLDLASTYFEAGEFIMTKETIERLADVNPDHKPEERQFLLAQVLESIGETTLALTAYAEAMKRWIGPAAKCRYAILLKKTGNIEEARNVFQEIITTAQISPRHFTKIHKYWINIARREMRQI